jgi:formylglycine-generating enzyme required for sulfatase activity
MKTNIFLYLLVLNNAFFFTSCGILWDTFTGDTSISGPIFFDARGGFNCYEISGDKNSIIILPYTSRPNSEFEGWFSQTLGKGVYYGKGGSNHEIKQFFTMYAHWTNEKPQELKDTVINDIECVLVKAGAFVMGDRKYSEADDKGQRKVTITKNYYISKYPITFQQLAVFLNNTENDRFNEKDFEYGLVYNKDDAIWAPKNGYENIPILLTWNTADEYCKFIGGRLPTEAEWEFAAKGGNNGNGYDYSGSDNLDEVAWYAFNSGRKRQPVGIKNPNELGIYDMTGNVYEWCNDWYMSDLGTEDATNPTGPDFGISRVRRGGNVEDAGAIWNWSRSTNATRSFASPTDANGFRVVFDED